MTVDTLVVAVVTLVSGLGGALVGGWITGRAASKTAREAWERESAQRHEERLLDQLLLLWDDVTTMGAGQESIDPAEATSVLFGRIAVLRHLCALSHPQWVTPLQTLATDIKVAFDSGDGQAWMQVVTQ